MIMSLLPPKIFVKQKYPDADVHKVESTFSTGKSYYAIKLGELNGSITIGLGESEHIAWINAQRNIWT